MTLKPKGKIYQWRGRGRKGAEQKLKERQRGSCRRKFVFGRICLFLTPERRDALTPRTSTPALPLPPGSALLAAAARGASDPEALRRRRQRQRRFSELRLPSSQTGGGAGCKLHTERAPTAQASCSTTAPRGWAGSAQRPPPRSGRGCR